MLQLYYILNRAILYIQYIQGIPGFRHWCQVPVHGEVRRVIKIASNEWKTGKEGGGKGGYLKIIIIVFGYNKSIPCTYFDQNSQPNILLGCELESPVNGIECFVALQFFRLRI